MRIGESSFPVLALAWAGLVTGAAAARACEAAVHYTFNEPVEIEGVLKSGIGPTRRRASSSIATSCSTS
jgi:hypothetical protein